MSEQEHQQRLAEDELRTVAYHLDAEADSDSILHAIREIEADLSIYKDRATTAEAEVKRIREELDALKQVRRLAADAAYMLQAYRNMLGPVALDLVKKWEADGVTRFHCWWGPDATEMSGEERAQVLLNNYMPPPHRAALKGDP